MNQLLWRQSQEENRVATLNSYGQINKVWYLFPQGGGPRGSFSSFATLAPNLRNRDLIYLSGVLSEQALAPLGVFDVTILGAANTPRQATNSGVPTGGGAYWKAPSSPAAATALLTLREQGWTIANICFNPHTSSPAIEGIRAESATYPDPSHLMIDGCYFIGGGTGQIGFQDSGGLFNVRILNSKFKALGGVAIKGIAGAGIATPLEHQYIGNQFIGNTNDIIIGCSGGRIMYNTFKATTTQKVDLTAGANEIVQFNSFDDNAADIDPAHGYTGSSTGTWGNYTLNQAALQVGQPA